MENNQIQIQVLDPIPSYRFLPEECDHQNVYFTERWYKKNGKVYCDISDKLCPDCGRIFAYKSRKILNEFPFAVSQKLESK